MVLISHWQTIYGNTVRFASYPSSIKPAYNTEDALKFPRGKTLIFMTQNCFELTILVTLCTNGAHSLTKIKENFPELSGIDLSILYSGINRRQKGNKTMLSYGFTFQIAKIGAKPLRTRNRIYKCIIHKKEFWTTCHCDVWSYRW